MLETTFREEHGTGNRISPGVKDALGVVGGDA